MVVRYMPNSGYGGPPGTSFMTIFVFYVSAQIPNIEYYEVYGGLHAPGGISSFFSLSFPSNGIIIMSGDPFLTAVMTIFINVTILDIRSDGRTDGRTICLIGLFDLADDIALVEP